MSPPRKASGTYDTRYARCFSQSIFFFNDTATTEIYTLSLHDALPISALLKIRGTFKCLRCGTSAKALRSEEHTSELQSRLHLVCRLLLGKKQPGHRRALIRRTRTAPPLAPPRGRRR